MKNNAVGTKLLMAVITLVVLTYFGIQIYQYAADPLTTAVAYAYQVEEGIPASGYVIRREQLLSDGGGGLLRQERTEGERVSAGGTVALLYADQASLDLQNEIGTLQTRLEQLQYAEEAALGSEVSLKLDSQITELLLSFRRGVASDRLDTAQARGQELRTLVLKRDYTYADPDGVTEEIAALESQLKGLRSQAAGGTKRITAPAAGLYSADTDGFETVLTPDMLDTLTPTSLNAAAPDESAVSPVGKLILGDTWYYAASLPTEDAERLEEARSVTLRFTKDVDRAMEMTVDSVSAPEGGRSVVILRCSQYLSQLTLLRRQSAQLIRRTIPGVRVPSDALRVREEDGQTGLYCVMGMMARFKPVTVLHTGDGFVVVEAASAKEETCLRPGDQVIISANDLYDGKVVGRA